MAAHLSAAKEAAHNLSAMSYASTAACSASFVRRQDSEGYGSRRGGDPELRELQTQLDLLEERYLQLETERAEAAAASALAEPGSFGAEVSAASACLASTVSLRRLALARSERDDLAARLRTLVASSAEASRLAAAAEARLALRREGEAAAAAAAAAKIAQAPLRVALEASKRRCEAMREDLERAECDSVRAQQANLALEADCRVLRGTGQALRRDVADLDARLVASKQLGLQRRGELEKVRAQAQAVKDTGAVQAELASARSAHSACKRQAAVHSSGYQSSLEALEVLREASAAKAARLRAHLEGVVGKVRGQQAEHSERLACLRAAEEAAAVERRLLSARAGHLEALAQEVRERVEAAEAGVREERQHGEDLRLLRREVAAAAEAGRQAGLSFCAAQRRSASAEPSRQRRCGSSGGGSLGTWRRRRPTAAATAEAPKEPGCMWPGIGHFNPPV